MADLSNELNNSIVELKARHTALLEAVQGFRTNSIGKSKDELTALYSSLNAQLEDEESTLLGMLARASTKPQPSLVMDIVPGRYLSGKRRLEKGVEFDDLVAFSRASEGRHYDATGALVVAPADQPRIQHDPLSQAVKGILLEGQRTNLLKQSETFSVAPWACVSASVGLSTVRPPVGLGFASLLTAGSVAVNQGYCYQLTATPGQGFYTYSVFVKKGNTHAFSIQPTLTVNNGPAGSTVSFNLDTKTVVSSSLYGSGLAVSAKVEDVGQGWLRCSVTVEITGVVTGGATIRFFPFNSAVKTPAVGDSCYIWGAQHEQGASPSSYIPTPTTFTSRASTATYFDANGVMQTAAANVARDNHHVYIDGQWVPAGLLVEGQATNLLTYSSAVSNSAWAKAEVSVVGGATVSPDGTTSADKIVESNATSVHVLVRYLNSVQDNTTYCFSCFVKPAGRETVYLRALKKDGAAFVGAKFDLQTGTVVSQVGSAVSPSIQYAGNGFWRCSICVDFSSGATTPAIYVYSGGIESYQGDGTSGIYIWGAQLEAGSTATSYIPTTTAQVTRAADASTSVAVTRAADIASLAPAAANNGWTSPKGTWIVEVNDAKALERLLSFNGYGVLLGVNGSGRLVLVKTGANTGKVYADGALVHEITPYHGVDLTAIGSLLLAEGDGSVCIAKVRYLPKELTAQEIADLEVA